MKPTSKRLIIVVELAERQLNSAAEQMVKAKQQLQFEQGRLEELESYFVEYQRQAKQQSHTGISVTRLMNFNHFLNNLRQAIDQQGQTIARLEKVCDQARQRWLAMKAKHKNLSSLQEKAHIDEALAREKRLQRELDDNYSLPKKI